MDESTLTLLAWLIPLFPFLAFGLIVLFTNRNKRLSAGVAIGGMGISFLLAQIVFWSAVTTHGLAEHPWHMTIDWLPVGDTPFQMGVMIDPLTAAMLFMVTLVCLMIFIYSYGYMGVGNPEQGSQRGWPALSGAVDALASRFFAYISLFACGMLGLVVADNLLMLFVFWEIMGLCSYLLIGFWWARNYPDPQRITPRQAGMKAFLTTRVGDVIMLLGILLLYSQTGTLSFSTLLSHETLEHLAHVEVFVPLFGLVSAATVAAVLVFGGTVGKSSQFPLHVWLPDAMEGPTPVSALIHAATMVSAGVYLIVRMFPLYQAVEHGHNPASGVVAFIGAFTALAASTVAVAQYDIKRVLAYSTISQLGYMVAAIGIGAYVAAAFHLLTHAFFKALLFLASGSVIHGMEHGHHHVAHHGHGGGHGHDEAFDANDMRYMGGLLQKMPRTGWTFIIGGLALSGFPILTAGFWSKDEILSFAWNENTLVFVTLALSALLTAFYTGRQIFMTFFGQPRTEAAAHGHESPGSMTWPLIILAVFALLGGFVGVPEDFPLLGSILGGNPFHHFVGEVVETVGVHLAHHHFSWGPVGVSVLVALGGLFLGWLVYGRKPMASGEVDPLKRWLGPVHTVLENKYYVDELYRAVFIRPTVAVSKKVYAWLDRGLIDGILHTVAKGAYTAGEGNRWFDKKVVDRTVDLVAIMIGSVGKSFRSLQTGRVQNYLLVAAVSVAVFVAFYLVLF